ncbi:MAG: 2Fe-2S iron-sulfur cluster binding domain-containing protein [Chlorobiaceae bacterium]|nr:2Fe-2S iron-sulfur cluster binding domain-containing protein [Chlorobiaceae bacterium]NTV60334.1 2Fe-2S iron-sulfur cluster binding domain-containing protein [Chlorobiaceae bacterium]
MIISVNDKPCEAQIGDLLLKTAQNHNCHIGYICGGNAICQSCFIYVKEGAEYLSEPGEEERTFISQKLLDEGGRLACRTFIRKEGTVKVLSRAENLRRIVLGLNVPGFITYARTIGYNVVNQLPGGTVNIISRVRQGRLNPLDTLKKIGSGLAPASLFAVNAFVETFPFVQYPVSLLSGAAKAVSAVYSGWPPLPVACGTGSGTVKDSAIETVKISVK